MKQILIFFFFLTISLSLQAQVKNVTVKIDGNTYNCLGNMEVDKSAKKQDCKVSTKGFETTMSYCTQGLSPASCAKRHWPVYKENSPTCIYDGIEICLSNCTRGLTAADCAELCQ